MTKTSEHTPNMAAEIIGELLTETAAERDRLSEINRDLLTTASALVTWADKGRIPIITPEMRAAIAEAEKELGQ